MAEKEHRAQDYAEGGLNLKINFRKLKYYNEPKGILTILTASVSCTNTRRRRRASSHR